MNNEIYQQAKQAAKEITEAAGLKPGNILVVGCSSSEVAGGVIGHDSSLETAEAVFAGIYAVLKEKGIYLAAQCCEHLNRAICVERDAVPGAEEVCVVPQPKAGGSFATTAYRTFRDPVMLEESPFPCASALTTSAARFCSPRAQDRNTSAANGQSTNKHPRRPRIGGGEISGKG